MGRQAHVTRLALGRSPYGPPLRDEDGDFILGPHAHVNDAPGYRQDYDDRGHPRNHASVAAARKLRKAQNDVLATVGVVVKKGEDRKTKWEKLDDDQKWDVIRNENSRGEQFRIEDRIAGVVLPWYFVSLRRRFMTLNPYFLLPVTNLMVKESRLLGPLSLPSAGLPMFLLSSIPQIFRYYCSDTDIEDIVNYINPWQDPEPVGRTVSETVTWLMSTSIALCIELPLSLHATLQSLQMVPAAVIMGWRSFVPFSSASLISLPAIPKSVTPQTLSAFVASLVQSPLCLYLIRDRLHQELGYRLYALLRQILTKPDRPDPMSAKVSDENEDLGGNTIAGMGHPWGDDDSDRHIRYHGPRSFWGAFRLAFPPVYELLDTLSRRRIGASRGKLSREMNLQLRAAARERHWLTREEYERHSRPTAVQSLDFQRHVVCSVFRRANLIPTEELVDPVAWAQDIFGPAVDSHRARARGLRWPVYGPAADNRQHDEVVNNVLSEAFRAMHVNDAVFIQASNGQAVISVQPEPDDASNVAARDNVHTINAAQVPLEALLQGVSDIEPQTQLIERRETRLQQQRTQAVTGPATISSTYPDRLPSSPPTPTPGLSRAVSLLDPQITNTSTTSLRPLRRPTETDDSLAAISQTLRAEAENLPTPHASPPGSPVRERLPVYSGAIASLPFNRHRLYRVTMLSNHVADSLAWHASALLTSLILWPFEAMYLRSVANWALQNPAMGSVIDPWWAARLGFGVLGRPIDIFGLGTWFGGAPDAGGRLRYVGGILLTLGLEGMIRGAYWRFSLWWVKRLKDEYGWGRF